MGSKKGPGSKLENKVFMILSKKGEFELVKLKRIGNNSGEIVLEPGRYEILEPKRMGPKSKTDIFVKIRHTNSRRVYDVKISVKDPSADYTGSWMAYETIIKYIPEKEWQSYVKRACDYFNKIFRPQFNPQSKKLKGRKNRIPEGFTAHFSFNKRTIKTRRTYVIPINDNQTQILTFSGVGNNSDKEVANCIFSRSFEEINKANFTIKEVFESLHSIPKYITSLNESKRPHLIFRTANFTESKSNYSKNRFIYRRPEDTHFQAVYEGIRGNRSGWGKKKHKKISENQKTIQECMGEVQGGKKGARN